MAEEETNAEDAPSKPSKLPMILGLVLALVGGGGGFYATWSGMILGGESHANNEDEVRDLAASLPDVAFVAVDPMTVSISSPNRNQYLRFRAELEVPTKYQPDVEKLLPRVVDVLNTYLRALETSDIEEPSALARLRAQMLRRIQIVTGPGLVNDLLVMEFVLN